MARCEGVRGAEGGPTGQAKTKQDVKSEATSPRMPQFYWLTESRAANHEAINQVSFFQ